MTTQQVDRLALHAYRRFSRRRRPGMTALEELALIYGDRYIMDVFDRYERRYGRWHR